MRNALVCLFCLVLLLTASITTDCLAAEAQAYASVTIIIPALPVRQEAAQVMTANEKDAEEEKTLQGLQLASAQATEDTQKN